MKERISGTIAIIITSFSVFLSADMLAESLEDTIRKTKALPALSDLAGAISPIGIMLYIYPIGLGICYWLFDRIKSKNDLNKRDGLIIWHFLSIIASMLLLSFSSTLSQYYILLDGHRYTTKIQWVGNGIISAFIASGIIYGIRKTLKNNT